MLRLIEWLDLRSFREAFYALMMRVTAICVLAVLVGHFGYELAQANTQNSHEAGAKLAPTPESLFTRTESLYAGKRVSQKPETLAEAQRCLAQAIYFEARSEPIAGWEAVADVVVNRAMSRRYPASICGVVFQGEYRRHQCQFSFACDGLSDRPKNHRLWERALHIAGSKLTSLHSPTHKPTHKATHYHADYVDPYWADDMVKLVKIGRHIFYADKQSIDF